MSKAKRLREALDALCFDTGATPSELRALLAPKKGRGKGPEWERTFCKLLSLWWTGQQRDDIFWRSQASGARATQRAKQGKATQGQYGDIAAADPLGEPLLRRAVFELKRGYQAETLHDLLDKPDKAGQQEWERWVCQALQAQHRAQSDGWVVVASRDRREAIVLVSDALWGIFHGLRLVPRLHMEVRVRNDNGKSKVVRLHATTLAAFWETTPESWYV